MPTNSVQIVPPPKCFLQSLQQRPQPHPPQVLRPIHSSTHLELLPLFAEQLLLALNLGGKLLLRLTRLAHLDLLGSQLVAQALHLLSHAVVPANAKPQRRIMQHGQWQEWHFQRSEQR
jgi:hypothetical protein